MIKGLKQHKYCYISKVTVQALILSLTMEQKTQFYKLLDDHIATLNAKKQESFCVTQAKYAKILSTLEVSKGAKCNEGASFKYWCHKHFKVEKIGTNSILYCQKSSCPVVSYEDMFETILRCHDRVGHSGRDKTWNEIKTNYSWIKFFLFTFNLILIILTLRMILICPRI